jgi:hypothetical protein
MKLQPILCQRFFVLALALFAIVISTPLHAQNYACVAGTPATDPNVATSLANLLGVVNSKWSTVAAGKIDPLAFGTGDVTAPCPSGGDTDCFALTGLTTCEHTTANFNLSQYTGLKSVLFTNLAPPGFNSKDVATHTAWGPDASKITDGVFAPEGTTWNNPSFTVVLPFLGVPSNVTIDLGSAITICGTSACAPVIQADRHNFQLDYWDDTTSSWIGWGSSGEVGGSGLITRPIHPTTGTQAANFTTRYVRVWAESTADDNNFSVSELQLKNTSGVVVSTGKVAIGPRPFLITNGTFAPAGTTWNDANAAVVLRNDGPGNALVIDLGGNINICGSDSNSCGCPSGTVCEPQIQADKNQYQVDYSVDGQNWVSYSQLPTVSSDGLQTRTLTPISKTSPNPNFIARYVRIWGLSGDGNYSVSEVMLHNSVGSDVSTGALTFGPERVATNGVVAPAGADWNDPRYAMILSPCLNGIACPPGSTKSTTGALLVDLTGNFQISGIDFQGDRHQFQIDYLDGSTWKPLTTVPESGDSGLISRSVTFSPMTTARYLMIYGSAGDDDNYSVSSVKVYTAQANTPCAYASGANAGKNFSCSYDGPIIVQVPTTSISVAFTVDSASAYLRCTTPGIASASSKTVASIPAGTTCTATLRALGSSLGGFCSGACPSGTPATLLSTAQIGTPTALPFTLSDMSCTNDTGSLTSGLEQAAAAGAAQAVQQLFNGLAPSLTGHCAAPTDIANTEVRGVAKHVGIVDDIGHVHIAGELRVHDRLKLNALTVTLEQLLFERGGVEELVRTGARNPLTPLQLTVHKGSTAHHAVYTTARHAEPRVRAEFKRTKKGVIEYSIEVHRATLPTPASCSGAPPAARLATRFTLADRSGPPIDIRAIQDWECEGGRLHTP